MKCARHGHEVSVLERTYKQLYKAILLNRVFVTERDYLY